mgnify:CR=1 FL=1
MKKLLNSQGLLLFLTLAAALAGALLRRYQLANELLSDGTLVPGSKIHIVLIVLLVLMFRTEKAPEKRTSISTERYTAGVYSSPVTLGDTVVDVTVTVDPDRIKAIDLNNLSETTSTMYPLIRPAVEELEAQILEKQSTKDITWEATGKYTAGILLNAIEKALDQAEGSVFSE